MKFEVGQRVTGTFHGEVRNGRVALPQKSTIVWVLWDGRSRRELEWAHEESLTVVPPQDAQVENHGSLYLIRPLTEEGKDWLHQHTNDDVQWFGGALVVEPRYVENLVEGMRGDGLNL